VHYGRFGYDGDRPSGWRDLSDLWVHGYWVYDWSDQYQRVQQLDRDKKEVWPEPPYPHYGYKKGQRFYFLNVLEELDEPGEWYLDRQSGMLYFWPPGPVATTETSFPELHKPMLALDQASFVRVRGILFECSRAGAVLVKEGAHDEIAGCTFRNLGDTAVDIQGGTHHLVRSCDVYEVAATGSLDHVRVETNLIADTIVFEGSFDGRGPSKTCRNGDPAVVAEFGKRGNILVQGNPGFGDLQGQDFRFRPGSPAARFRFERIPFERIGLVKDEYRQALPSAADASSRGTGVGTWNAGTRRP